MRYVPRGKGSPVSGLMFGALLGSGLLWSTPAGAQRPSLAMLDRITPGEWVVRSRGENGQPDSRQPDWRLCLDNARPLIQLRHRGQPCRQFVVQDEAHGVTISYTCGTAGSGLTRLRWENEQLLQVEAQGIAQGLPFAFDAEARRVGACRPVRAGLAPIHD